jgi:hypothetical protein
LGVEEKRAGQKGAAGVGIDPRREDSSAQVSRERYRCPGSGIIVGRRHVELGLSSYRVGNIDAATDHGGIAGDGTARRNTKAAEEDGRSCIRDCRAAEDCEWQRRTKVDQLGVDAASESTGKREKA